MSEYILDVLNQTSKLDWVFPFQRTGAFPLDRSSLFSSLLDAEAYALGIPEGGAANDERKLAGTSYVGQTLSVYDEDANAVTLYIIEADRSLKEVGSAPLGDNASIEIIDGKIQLKDFGIGYYAYVPAVKDDDGNIITESSYKYTEGFKAGLQPRVILDESGDLIIAWYEPGTETVEDVAANIESVSKTVDSLDDIVNAEGGLVDQVEDLQEEIGHAADDAGNEATGLYKAIEDLEKNKANATDVYTKSEANKAIEDAVAAAAHLQRTVVNSTDEIDPGAQGAENYIYMVPTGLQEDDDKYDEYMVIDGVVEKVGSWEVNLDAYATTTYVNTELAKKVDKVEGSRLMTNVEGTKLEGIEAGAQKNYISSVESEFNVSDGKLSLVEIAQAKITGLVKALEDITQAIEDANTAIDGKVDADENGRLITLTEAQKLAAVKDLIQSVDTDKFTVDENGKLLLNSVEIDEIEGLVSALANKVDKVEGSRLITTAEAAKLEKLVFDEESGEVEISGTVSAANVQELYDNVVRIVTGTGTGTYDDAEKPLLGIQAGAEKNFINGVNSTEFTVEDRVLSLKAVPSAKVEGLNALFTQVNSLDAVLNGYTDEDGAIVKGVVANLEELTLDLETNYVTKVEFNSTVSNLNDLINTNTENIELLTEQVNVLDSHLTWKDLNN